LKAREPFVVSNGRVKNTVPVTRRLRKRNVPRRFSVGPACRPKRTKWAREPLLIGFRLGFSFCFFTRRDLGHGRTNAVRSRTRFSFFPCERPFYEPVSRAAAVRSTTNRLLVDRPASVYGYRSGRGGGARARAADVFGF